MSRSRRRRAILPLPNRGGRRRFALILGAVAVIALAGAVAGVRASLIDAAWSLLPGSQPAGEAAIAELHPQLREIVTRVTTVRARLGALVDRTGVPDSLMRVMVMSQTPDLRIISERAHAAQARLAAIEGDAGNARDALVGATDRIGAAADMLRGLVTSTASVPAAQMQQLVRDIDAAASVIAAIDRQSTGGVS